MVNNVECFLQYCEDFSYRMRGLEHFTNATDTSVSSNVTTDLFIVVWSPGTTSS